MLSLCVCCLCCGCAYVNNPDQLLAPPELTGEMYPIAQALKESAGSGYKLEYPTAGVHRSAVVLEDINADAVFEAFAFYSTNDDEMINMHINAICQRDGKWVSVANQTIVATGVETVEFCDLDGDGTEEILVGWEVNGNSEKQLSVFAFAGDSLVQKMLQPYTGFLCCDLDGNGVNEIFVHLLNTAERTNKATIYSYNGDGMAQTAGCGLDQNVKTAAAPTMRSSSMRTPGCWAYRSHSLKRTSSPPSKRWTAIPASCARRCAGAISTGRRSSSAATRSPWATTSTMRWRR